MKITRRGRFHAILMGIASLFDTAGALHDPIYDPDIPGELQDADALASDWEAVGGDMWAAIYAFEDEHPDLWRPLR